MEKRIVECCEKCLSTAMEAIDSVKNHNHNHLPPLKRIEKTRNRYHIDCFFEFNEGPVVPLRISCSLLKRPDNSRKAGTPVRNVFVYTGEHMGTVKHKIIESIKLGLASQQRVVNGRLHRSHERLKYINRPQIVHNPPLVYA